MLGTLNVIGIGPGDPELMTLKAVRIIGESEVLCVPRGKAEGTSLALSIVKQAVDLEGKEMLEAYFPMKKTMCRADATINSELDEKWSETTENILSRLRTGKDVAFITLGDPAIYSTFFYLYDRLLEAAPDLNVRIVPGVSSINAAASSANIYLGLGNDRIAVLPANYLDNLRETLEAFDTVILMKVNKVFNDILILLGEMDLIEKALCISRVGMQDEQIFRNIKEINQDKLNYFSMVIVRK